MSCNETIDKIKWNNIMIFIHFVAKLKIIAFRIFLSFHDG